MELPAADQRPAAQLHLPGRYCSAVSEVLAAVESARLWVTDIEVLCIRYAHALRQWAQCFEANRKQARVLYDERFCRMWEFYLYLCEMAFRNGPIMVFGSQVTRRRDTVPLHRDHI